METRGIILLSTTAIAIVILLLVLVAGPARISRMWEGYKADAYGADWVVVQYAQDGSVISHWELKSKSVGNEEQSDGIYFTDNSGNVVHLSGHYIYVQVKSDHMAAVKDHYVSKRLKASNGE